MRMRYDADHRLKPERRFWGVGCGRAPNRHNSFGVKICNTRTQRRLAGSSSTLGLWPHPLRGRASLKDQMASVPRWRLGRSKVVAVARSGSMNASPACGVVRLSQPAMGAKGYSVLGVFGRDSLRRQGGRVRFHGYWVAALDSKRAFLRCPERLRTAELLSVAAAGVVRLCQPAAGAEG
jgi:hypothetical protein